VTSSDPRSRAVEGDDRNRTGGAFRSSKPRLLDLFCGAGGAAVGYHRAGFDVVGVDIKPQPNYPFEFWQADALDPTIFYWFDAIHASPPCQAYSRARILRNREHPDLVAAVRDLLVATGLPYVIENVPGAPLRDPTVLCGTSFGLAADGFELRRHRLFETSFPAMSLPCSHLLPALPIFGHSPNGDFMRRYGRGFDASLRYAAMGIDWMNRNELSEAIPPAYTEHIGGYLMAEIKARAAA
jgi:DNA (cytosine-5)-methyltransferase 1